MDSWWSHPDTTHCYGGETSDEYVEYTGMTSSDQPPYEPMQIEGYDQVGPSFEANEVDCVAAPQGFREHVSKVTFGTGGAHTPAGPPYVTNNLGPAETMKDLSLQANPQGPVDSQIGPNTFGTSDGCVDPCRLMLTVEDYDQLPAGAQQAAPVYPEPLISDPGCSGLSHETYNVFLYPQERPFGYTSTRGSHSSIDQLTVDMQSLITSVQIPIELGNVPFAQTRRLSTVPWSHTVAIEQTIPDGVYGEDIFPDRMNSRSTGETSLCNPDHDGSMLSDIGYAASTNSSWALGANPTDFGGMSLYLHQVDAPQTIQRRRHSCQYGSRGFNGAGSDDPHFREHPEIMLNRHEMATASGTGLMRSRSERLAAPRNAAHRRSRASPAPSDVSIASSVAWTPVVCHVEGCKTQFTGQFGRGNLSRHLRLVHNRRVFPCEVGGCFKIYKRQDALKKHFDRKHAPREPR